MTTSSTVLGLILLVIVISMIPTLAFASPSSPYSIGFAAGKRDAKTNLYDSTSACNDVQLYCSPNIRLSEGLLDGDYIDISCRIFARCTRHRIERHSHTRVHQRILQRDSRLLVEQRISRKGIADYQCLRSKECKLHPMHIRIGTCRISNRISNAKKCGIDLGKLPTHTNDNYRDFYLGLDQGGDAYDLVDGAHYLLYNGPPGHTAEYYAGWKFGYGLGLAFDSDCA